MDFYKIFWNDTKIPHARTLIGFWLKFRVSHVYQNLCQNTYFQKPKKNPKLIFVECYKSWCDDIFVYFFSLRTISFHRNGSFCSRNQKKLDLVPILQKVTIIGLQIFFTCTFYIFVTSYQCSLVGQDILQSFWAIFWRIHVK
jgi:hypothetical protein